VHQAAIAQLGERQTEDLEVLGSIPGFGKLLRRRKRTRSDDSRGVMHMPEFRDSIGVSISACHAEDPGSIPGRGGFFFVLVQVIKS
jgi:hypothetical protein